MLFKHEMKAKRVKAIKSKTFHRHNRKTGAMKVIDGETGEEIGDDDAALEGLDPDNSAEAKREYLRAQERMLLKHKNTSRWAKRAIKKGLAHLPGTKEAIAEQLRIGQELKRKIGIGGERGASRDSDDEEYSTDAESDSDGDGGGGGGGAGDAADRRRALAKAKLRTMQAIEEGQAGAEEEGGLFALPFMARHMKKKREEAETEAKQLLEEIEKAEREAATQRDSDDEGLGGQPGDGDWGKGAEKFDEPEPAQRTSRIMSFGGGGGAGRFVSAKGAGQPAKNDVDSDDDELTVKHVDPPGDDSDDDKKRLDPTATTASGRRAARTARRVEPPPRAKAAIPRARRRCPSWSPRLSPRARSRRSPPRRRRAGARSRRGWRRGHPAAAPWS